ncbi:hypothetical protein P3T73_11930 [Kiritimatiellota bacterium B12222]|nr:hypothetical protein P3T73_11930 [Kiritimatiellota bacterium B12222]
MQRHLLLLCFLITALRAQEETLDPSIFDGTGRDQEIAEPAEEGSSSEERAPEKMSPDETESAAAESGTELPPAEKLEPMPTETPEPVEISLPGSESEEEEEGTEGLHPAGPAGAGTAPSRAGERVESTEKIAPGHAVDYPWDI